MGGSLSGQLAMVVGLTLTGCAGQSTPAPRPLPASAAERRESLNALAAELFDALRRGDASSLTASADVVDALLTPRARQRVARAHPPSAASLATFRAAWSPARYAGFCAQGAREERARGGFGLRSPGWVMERLLLVAESGAQRSASWLEGQFVYTGEGWRALMVQRLELPRPGHADLELAPCDVEDGLREY